MQGGTMSTHIAVDAANKKDIASRVLLPGEL